MEDSEKKPSVLDSFIRMSDAYLANQPAIYSGRKGVLRFRPGGLMRLWHTVGWLVTLANYDKPMAEHLADALDQKLKYLNNYGESLTLESGEVCRNNVVMLDDDGTWGGWSVSWFSWIKPTDAPKDGWSRDGENVNFYRTYGISTPYNYYKFYMNGGLLFHGFKDDRTLAVRIGSDPNPWSIHT